jgi:hypothetical protein
MTVSAFGRRDVVVEVMVTVNVLLQDVIKVAIIDGVAPGPAHFAVDAGEAVGS